MRNISKFIFRKILVLSVWYIMYYLYNCRTLCGCVDWNMIEQEEGELNKVAPYVGVWIETPIIGSYFLLMFCRTLCGCVDWNLKKRERTAACWKSHPMWVCGLKHKLAYEAGKLGSRTLCGCVDWNFTVSSSPSSKTVAPYVGVWIETSMALTLRIHTTSHPMWVCGLKLKVLRYTYSNGVAPYVGVWIETL